MTISLTLAKILGPYCVIVALGVLLNLKTYRKMFEDFHKNSAVVYIGGVLALSFGLLIVQFHNIWVLDWPGLITLMGWMALAKGVGLIVFPGILEKAAQPYLKNPSILVIHLVIILLMGLILTKAGYF